MTSVAVQVLNPKTGATSTISVPLPAITPAAGRFAGDPGLGRIYWGQTREGSVPAVPARAAQYAQIVGQKAPLYPASVRRYMTPAQATVAGAKAAVADCATVLSWGSYPFLDFKEPASMSFAQVGQGQMNDVIDAIMQGLAALNKPAAVGFHQEPAGDGKGGAAEYASALNMIGQRRTAAGAKLVTVTGCLGIGSFAGFGGNNGDPRPWITALAPYVDVWGTHRYLQATDASPDSAWKTVEQTFGPFWDLLDAVDSKRAKFHGEWGIHTRAAQPTFAPAWMDRFYQYGVSRGLAVACFFDSGQNSANDWTLDLGGETTRLVKMAQQLAYPTTA